MSLAVDLTEQLIARPSITPNDAGCQDILAAHLRLAGFTIERMRFGEVDNLWAVHGEAEPLLCFAGHTDVVPAGPLSSWNSDPYLPVTRDGVLYGRGAADMKSGVAAMVTAAAEFVLARPDHQGSVALLITSDEEGPSIDGTRRVLETLRARGVNMKWCVVGEPSSVRQTGDTLKVGRRGSLSGTLVVHGVQGHVAYPLLAENAVHRLAPALAELTARVWDSGNEHFPPTSFQISNLKAGTGALNVIPGELVAHFNLRFAPVHTVEDLQRTIEEILHRHQVRHTLEWRLSAEPFYCPPAALAAAVSAAVMKVSGIQAEYATTGGTSDGRFFVGTGAQVVEIGVPNPTIHKANEGVRLVDIDALHAIFVHTLQSLLG